MRTLAARTLRKLFTRANASPTRTICAKVPHASPCRTQGCVTVSVREAANVESTKLALLKSVPYQGICRLMSRSSKVPIRATQQAANGFAKLGSKTAAISGPVLRVARTSPGSRTGSTEATRVTKHQNAKEPRLKSKGGGAESLIRITPAAPMTAASIKRSSVLGVLFPTGGQDKRPTGEASYRLKRREGPAGPLLRAHLKRLSSVGNLV